MSYRSNGTKEENPFLLVIFLDCRRVKKLPVCPDEKGGQGY